MSTSVELRQSARLRTWATLWACVLAQLALLVVLGRLEPSGWWAALAMGAAMPWWPGAARAPLTALLASIATVVGLVGAAPSSPLTALGVVGTMGLLPLPMPHRAVRGAVSALCWAVATAQGEQTVALAVAVALAMVFDQLGWQQLEREVRPQPPLRASAPLRRARAERDTLLERLASGIAGELDAPVTRALALLEDDHPSQGALMQVRQTLADLRQLHANPVRAHLRQRELGHVFSVASEQERGLAPVGARMRVAPPPEAVVFISELRLRQVLGPLLTNAWQAAGPSGTVALSAELREDGVHLHIDDDGHGLPPVDPARLFEPLWTTHPTQQSTGLGLTLARVAATAMGGTLLAGTSPLGGARFTVVLPLAPDEPAQTRPEASRG